MWKKKHKSTKTKTHLTETIKWSKNNLFHRRKKKLKNQFFVIIVKQEAADQDKTQVRKISNDPNQSKKKKKSLQQADNINKAKKSFMWDSNSRVLLKGEEWNYQVAREGSSRASSIQRDLQARVPHCQSSPFFIRSRENNTPERRKRTIYRLQWNRIKTRVRILPTWAVALKGLL